MFHGIKIKEKYRKPVMTATDVAKFQTLNIFCVILTHLFGAYGVTFVRYLLDIAHGTSAHHTQCIGQGSQ
jgi:hypothetical protein